MPETETLVSKLRPWRRSALRRTPGDELPGKLGVLFVHTATMPLLGADTWVQSRIIGGLDKATHDVHVACSFGSPGDRPPTYEVVSQIPEIEMIDVDLGLEKWRSAGKGRFRTWTAAMPSPLSFARLVVHAKRHRVRLVHTTDRPRDALASVLLARMIGASSIIHAHVAYDARWMGRVLRWSIEHADGLIAISEYVATTLVESGHDPDRVHVVLNAIDIGRWNPGVDRDERRAEFDVTRDEVVLLAVCRLFSGKGITELIRAVGTLHEQRDDIRLFVVGPRMQPNHLEDLMALTVELGIDHIVTFTGQRDDVPSFMAAADVYAMPSLLEPFGLVYLEAMAMELPVVALDSGGTREVVENGVDGLLSDPGDHEALVANLATLIDDPERRLAMGRHGRERVATKFTIEGQARTTEAVYRLLSSAATGAAGR